MKNSMGDAFHEHLSKLAAESIATGNEEAIRLGSDMLKSLKSKHGLMIAKETLAKPMPRYSGLTIMKAFGFKHLTIEGAVLDTRFETLFSDDERLIALKHLK